jgi:AraC family transcriptional regulator of arabinose operon
MLSITVQYKKFPNKIFDKMVKYHSHQYYELYYLIDGDRSYFLNKKFYQVTSGDFALSPPEVSHKMVGSVSESIIIRFSLDYLPAEIRDDVKEIFEFAVIKTPPQMREYVEASLKKIFMEYSKSWPYRDLIVKKLFSILMIELIRIFNKNPLEAYRDNYDYRIRNVIEYINENYANKMNIENLAEMALMSRSNFFRCFKNNVGISPNEYIQKVRIETAVKLLNNNALSVYGIAEKVGFSSVNYFSHIFKKNFGINPKKYRQNLLLSMQDKQDI